MVRIVFKYKDAFTNGKWKTQEGTYADLDQCISMNGLGVDCEYEIVSIEEIK